MGALDLGERTLLEEDRLRNRILEVRFTDLEEERALCKQLLDLAEAEHMMYSYAFANIYLVDSLLALGEFEKCDFYISRALNLCNEYGYRDLKLALCNFAGLYYQSLNDDQNALSYYLEGLRLADELGDSVTKAKLLNNAGRGFSWRGDMETAKYYIHQAFETIEPFLSEGDGRRNAVSYLTNLAVVCQSQGDREGSEHSLGVCERLGEASTYDRIRLECGWCSHFANFNEREKCLQAADAIIDNGIFEYENKYFAYDMCIDICGHLLDMNDQSRTSKFLTFLEESKEHMPLNTCYKVQGLKIRFLETHGITQGLLEAYRQYYQLLLSVREVDDHSRTQSLLSQIRLDQVVAERAELGKENRELERVGQLDDLTGLYNRRYFRKLLSKTFQNKKLTTLGCILVDVDFFKDYNDYYGHYLGDQALKTVSRALLDNGDEGIIAGRYGGDEFICLALDKSDDELASYVQAVLDDIAKQEVLHEHSAVDDRLTLSIGWCNESLAREFNADDLMRVADEALYEVKQTGRNGQASKRMS